MIDAVSTPLPEHASTLPHPAFRAEVTNVATPKPLAAAAVGVGARWLNNIFQVQHSAILGP